MQGETFVELKFNQLERAMKAFFLYSGPSLTDTPEMRPSTMMQTLCLVRDAIDLHTIRPHEMWTPVSPL